MILISTMHITRTRDHGNFFCPGCEVTRPYRLRTRRPFLTLYFIPTVPIGGAEPFVQCDTCRASYDVGVLELDRTAHETAKLEQFREDALRATVLVTTADGTITSEEIQAIQTVADRLLERPIDREELGALCSSARSLGITPANYIKSCKHRWTREQSIIVLQAAFLAASAEGELNPAQIAMLAELKRLLELTDQEYEQAIEDAVMLAE